MCVSLFDFNLVYATFGLILSLSLTFYAYPLTTPLRLRRISTWVDMSSYSTCLFVITVIHSYFTNYMFNYLDAMWIVFKQMNDMSFEVLSKSSI